MVASSTSPVNKAVWAPVDTQARVSHRVLDRTPVSGNRTMEVQLMGHYLRIGEVPPKRHTQFRITEGPRTGQLHYEELMGEEGFSSDSSLLYHRGVPSALVDS